MNMYEHGILTMIVFICMYVGRPPYRGLTRFEPIDSLSDIFMNIQLPQKKMLHYFRNLTKYMFQAKATFKYD